MKATFLNNEIWVLTFNGAFQRANIYKNNRVSEQDRKEFRKALRNHIEELVDTQYKNKIDQDQHIENIKSIVDFSQTALFGGARIAINFGVAQKLLNLYLKYSWCIGKIKTDPIHFPVDRLIQGKLNKEAEELNIPTHKLKAWTQFEDEEDYKEVIEFAKTVRTQKYPHLSLAEMELEIFTRR